jgi:hypothetical protein
MPGIETIRFTFKGYPLNAEYFYTEDHKFHLVGIEFDNPTQALMFVAESTGDEVDQIEKAVESAVEQWELDRHEYQKARDKLESWYPKRSYSKP